MNPKDKKKKKVEEKYDNTKSPDYAKKKKALAKKHGGAKNIKGHPQYEHHGIDIEHIDGSVTEITDVIKAPKMVAAPKLSNWREDFVWDEPVDEALKKPKLDIQEKGVKNKVEINPTVATEGYMSKDKEGHTTGGFRISNKEAKKAKERLKKKYKKEEVEQVDEKISASGYARAKKYREDQARAKDKKEQEYYANKAKTHKWDGEKWNKKEKVSEENVEEGLKQARKNIGMDPDKPSCWDGYKAKGTKKKGGKEVPNCVKEEEIDEMNTELSSIKQKYKGKMTKSSVVKRIKGDDESKREFRNSYKKDIEGGYVGTHKPTKSNLKSALKKQNEEVVDEGIGDMAIKAIEKTNPPYISKRSSMIRNIKLKQLKSYLKKQDDKKKAASKD